MARESGIDQERMNKDPKGSLNLIKLIAGLSMAADTHKNVLFAGEKGREKYKNTDFGNIDSIIENAVEGSDIAENMGMEAGGLPAYTTGLLLDVLSPSGLAISAAAKGGSKGAKFLAKMASPVETISEELGKKVVKKSLPKYFKENMSNGLKDFPHAERMADEAIETGVSKNLSNPEKALDLLKGKKVSKQVGGTKELPINEVVKTDGSLDAVGKRLSDVVKKESDATGKVNKGKIFREEMDKVRATNAKGIEYTKDENSLESILRKALTPTETKTQRITKGIDTPPPIPAAARETPPPIPDELGLDDMLSRIDKARVKPVKKPEPKTYSVQYEVDKDATLEELWEKKKSLNEEFTKATRGKPLNEWSDKDIALEGVIKNIDERLASAMSKEGKDSYKGLNQKYSAQSKIKEIMEDQLQTKNGSTTGNVARSGTEIATGGGGPAATGRAVKGIVNAVTGPKRRVQFGNVMQDRRVTTPVTEAISEGIEFPYDPKYLEDDHLEGQDSEPSPDTGGVEMAPESELGEGFEGFQLAPKSSSVEEIQDAGPATDIMAPQPDMGGVEEKMAETLSPVKAQWDPYFNEEVLNTFLPRDSERLLKNPTALLAKMHQVAPNQVAIFKEMMENDPEGLKEMAPKLAMMYPAVFEKDKYGTFDGKILDPNMQQKFLFDLAEDESMDAIEKAQMAMKVQRGESIHG